MKPSEYYTNKSLAKMYQLNYYKRLKKQVDEPCKYVENRIYIVQNADTEEYLYVSESEGLAFQWINKQKDLPRIRVLRGDMTNYMNIELNREGE